MSVPYQQEISATKNLPTAIVFLMDQSESMADEWAGAKQSKAEAVADIVNKALDTVIQRCTKGIDVRDYFHVGAITYSGSGAHDAFGAGLMKVSELKPRARMETRRKQVYVGAGQVQEVDEEIPVWFDPQAEGGTPMGQAFEMAAEWLTNWISSYGNSFPPMVFNITDGQPNDQPGAERSAQRVLSLSTSDGPVILANCHISETLGSETVFPESDSALADDFGRFLFRISSQLPPQMATLGQEQFEKPVGAGAKAFIFGGGPVALVNLLDIGTRVQAGQMDR